MDMEKVAKNLEECIEHIRFNEFEKIPFWGNCQMAMTDALALLKEQPEIVRCKDCEYWQDNNGGYPHPECRWGHDETPDENDFCSFASDKRQVT